MIDNSQNDFGNQQIDLSHISRKVGQFLENFSTNIFRGILFVKRNILTISILFVLGAAIGFYLDRTTKSYSDEIIVLPNFGSIDYLNGKIRLIESKIHENDTVFLKETVGIKSAKRLKKISIKPIVDVYKYINESKNTDKNFELLKLVAEGGDFKKAVKEDMTSKNFPYHIITVETHNRVDTKTMVEPILNYLNSSAYFSKLQKVYLSNTKMKIAQNDVTIAQINGLLNSFSNNAGTQKNDKLVYYSENSQLNEIIKAKNDLSEVQGELRIDLNNFDRIVKDVTIITNIRNINGANTKLKFLLPVLFVFLFIVGGYMKSFYRRQTAKLNQENKKN